MPMRSKSESGQAMLEFSIVSISLVFMFAGAFTVGAMLNKALQVSNVTRSAAVLMVRSVTDPTESLNLAIPANQRILMREATGLGMSTDASFDPLVGTGNGAIFLSQIIMVGPLQCSAAGLTAHPTQLRHGIPGIVTITAVMPGATMSPSGTMYAGRVPLEPLRLAMFRPTVVSRP